MRATRMEASSKKIFQTRPPPPFALKLSPPSRRPPFTLSFPSLCFSFCLSFSPPNFSIPFHLFTLPSFLLSISICAIGRAIPVSLFTGGFCTHLSRHLRASHATSSDHPFNEKTLSSPLNELYRRRITRQSLRRFIRHFWALYFCFYCCVIGVLVSSATLVSFIER